MSNQDLIKQLKKLKNKDQVVKGTLVLESNSVLETTYHSGTWNDHEFECCCLAYWNSADVEVDINLHQLIELLEIKGLNQFDYSDFDNVSLGDANNPDISVSEIEWVDDEPSLEEKEENDFEEIELYSNSEINDCECTFESGSVLSMKFNIEGNSYIIDNSSYSSNENKEFDEKYLDEVFTEHSANEEGFEEIDINAPVKIGNQFWMPKNLNVDTFRNGDIIPEVKTVEDWQAAGINGQPAYCTYNNDPLMGEKYGKLYNWHAVNDPRGLAPVGFRVPSNQDWQDLAAFLGGDQKKIGKKLKATFDWNVKELGTDEFGFSALPGGNRGHYWGSYEQIGLRANWWSSTDQSVDSAWSLYESGNWWTFSTSRKGEGISVRCIID
ncbi:fibrobacter succinogenes major paralogous domain-containing protein [Aquirufa lenticrescens]